MKAHPQPMSTPAQSLTRRLAENLAAGLAVGIGILAAFVGGVTLLAHLA